MLGGAASLHSPATRAVGLGADTLQAGYHGGGRPELALPAPGVVAGHGLDARAALPLKAGQGLHRVALLAEAHGAVWHCHLWRDLVLHADPGRKKG